MEASPPWRPAAFCPDPAACGYLPGEELRQHWEAGFAGLSLALSAAGAFTSLTITHHLKSCVSRRSYVTLVLAAALAVGVNTVWSMHFVGMKALRLEGGVASGAQGPIPVHFEVGLTLLSALIAWGFACAGLHVVAGRHAGREGRRFDVETVGRLSLASLLIAGGVCMMHFFGMASQAGFFTMEYHPGIVASSVLVAMVASSAGLLILFIFPNTLAIELVSACVISGAVNGMHYCGMASATYRVSTEHSVFLDPGTFDIDGLQVALLTLFADLGLYVVCNHYGEAIRRAIEADTQRALQEARLQEALHKTTTEKQQAMEKAKQEQALRLKVSEAIASVEDLGHPMIVIPARSFLDLSLEDVGTSHEAYREWGRFKILDNMKDVAEFKDSGAVIVFFSYECLAYSHAGPNEVQLAAMKAAVLEIAARNPIASTSSVYAWLDCLSIPRRNMALKKAAIDSMYTFAGIPDFMVIVCPESVHAGTLRKADSETLKSRMWCRTEQLAHCCSQGIKTMYLHRGRVLEPLPEGWMESACGVHDARTTCCQMRHSKFCQCDREMVVLPLLALYYDVYSRVKCFPNHCGSKDYFAWELICKHKVQIFPERFQYRSELATEERDLFGDLLQRVEQHVDTRLLVQHASVGLPVQSLDSFRMGPDIRAEVSALACCPWSPTRPQAGAPGAALPPLEGDADCTCQATAVGGASELRFVAPTGEGAQGTLSVVPVQVVHNVLRPAVCQKGLHAHPGAWGKDGDVFSV